MISSTKTVDAVVTASSVLDFDHYTDNKADNKTHITTPIGSSTETPITSPLNSGPIKASIFNMSSDGKVAGGNIYTDGEWTQATIWFGPAWDTKIFLPVKKGGHVGPWYFSTVRSFSADGKIAGGNAPVETDTQHAVIWSGENWQTITNLDEWKPDDVIVSKVNSLSADGRIAGGSSTENIYHKVHGMIWSGENWGTKTDVGLLHTTVPVHSVVSVLSADGKVAGGYFSAASGEEVHGIIWSGENWATQTHLDNASGNGVMPSESSEVLSLSEDGKVAGGYYAGEDKNPHATIWYGAKWENKVDLEAANSSKSGSSKVYAVSSDGKLAGGGSDIIDNDYMRRAIIWYGEKWAQKIDVGTLNSDVSGSSEILGFSRDGTLAIGTSSSDSIHEHPFIVRLPRYVTHPTTDKPTMITESITPEKTTSIVKDPAVIPPFMIDVTNTRSTLNATASDSFSLMKAQQSTLTHLQQGCVANGNNLCWLIHANPTTVISKDVLPIVNVGYGLTEVFSVGGVITRPLSSSLPKSHKINGNNVGIGLYADWHALRRFGEFYFRPALAFSQYKLDIQRSMSFNTEYGEGNSTFNGVSSSLEWGGGHPIFNKDLGCFWHTGLRYNKLSRGSYREARTMNLPISYSKINYSTIIGDIGADIRVSILKPIILVSGIKVEHILKENSLISDADISGLSINRSSSHAPQIGRTLKSGIIYVFNQNLSLSVLESLTKTNAGHQTWRLALRLAGTF
ncbi:hypothetical protein [Candidatus Erwinia haradaeae]|uniref:hypothetical protein n=1 Tax=Candidatus Erwinia haradaeae TaxID=1922217 RepID=UPI0013002C28|nr:hypothetical protein [Candidatus Erwinia haradaeae]